MDRRSEAAFLLAEIAKVAMARGSKPGEYRGGRKRGTPNKKNAAAVEMAKRGGIMPLEYMLGLMRQPIPKDADASVKASLQGLRFEAAKAAAPYVHPRLAATEITGAGGGPLVVKIAY